MNGGDLRICSSEGPALHCLSREFSDLLLDENGRLQIIDVPETIPFKLQPIAARTFSVALKHMSRAQVVAVDQFAEKYRMSVQSLDFRFVRVKMGVG